MYVHIYIYLYIVLRQHSAKDFFVREARAIVLLGSTWNFTVLSSVNQHLQPVGALLQSHG